MSMGSPKINYRAYPIRLPNLFSKFILSFLPSRNTPTIMFQILHVSSLLLSSLTQETQFSYFAQVLSWTSIQLDFCRSNKQNKFTRASHMPSLISSEPCNLKPSHVNCLRASHHTQNEQFFGMSLSDHFFLNRVGSSQNYTAQL